MNSAICQRVTTSLGQWIEAPQPSVMPRLRSQSVELQ